MSGFGGGFGGFGQNNQAKPATGFGGFGGNTTNTGFGATNNTGGFGSTNTAGGGGLFGGGGGGQTSGFGSTGGFGATQTSGFGGSSGGFGAPASSSGGGGLFGAGTATSGSTGGFGGFGAAAAPATTAFGGGATGGSIFGGGGNKTGFGGSPSTGAFGAPAATNAFGGASNSAFGAPQSTALGAGAGECQGTGNVPFQAFVEKEPNSTGNQQNSFQSISFQQPYQKFSPEELRLADYTQGRRYGNQSGQPGAFGASSGFGSFGQTNQPAATGFGATPAAAPGLFGGGGGGFGATSQPQSTGFGSTPAQSGGLFGAKPAGGLFGAQPAAQPAGGLFGNAGASTGFGGSSSGGFGQQNNAPGTSLFGQNNAAAAKPAFSFAPPPSSGTGGFGSTAAPATGFGGGSGGGGLFGSQPAQSSPFGQAQQPAPAQSNPFGGFGQTSQPQAAGSLFGAAKPATTSLFGQPAASSAGGGLFGGAQPAASNPFGGTATTQPAGGLFGNKPATASAGLFGAPQQQSNNNSSSLFGGGGFGAQAQPQQQQQQQSTGLFGGLSNNNQAKPTLFGAQPQQQASGGLFGNSGTQQGGLFGATNTNQQQQQQPQGSLFGGSSSLFGGSQQNQQPQQQQGLTASINDISAFGHSALFVNLAASQPSNPGPLATPLRGSNHKKAAALPIYKLNPASSSRFSTPAKRGFGFSYSTYGSPNSASSTPSSPGGNFSNSLLGGSLSRGLSKSMSTSSLRRSFTTEESILAPGAFSSSPNSRAYGSTGSMKKLVINRSLRGDLFSPPIASVPEPASKPNGLDLNGGGRGKKRVSFGDAGAGSLSPLKQVQNNPTPTSQDLGLMRPRSSAAGASANNIENQRPEMEQVKNNELAIVPEEGAVFQPRPTHAISTEDQQEGNYWMEPSKEEIEHMPLRERKITDFTIGRDGVGKVTFKAEVDLSKFNLDEIFDKIVVLVTRSCTVYPKTSEKPPEGQGLNVPSVITLKNSWPRHWNLRGEKNQLRLKKHISRLGKVPNTKLVNYNEDTGEWTFTVEHFTTYELDYDDEDEDETDGDGMSEFGQSTLSAPPDTPTPKTRTPKRDFDDTFASISDVSQNESDPEDTFDFRNKKKKAVLPGAFGGEPAYEDDDVMEDGYGEQEQQSFLDERSVGSQSESGVEEPVEHDTYEDDESVSIVDQEMAGSFPQADNTTERVEDSLYDEGMDIAEATPGAAMMERMRALKASGTPLKGRFTAGNDWTSTLKTTISPEKQDRALLKSLINIHGNDSRLDGEPTPVARHRTISDGRGFATSIDMMNSLFGQSTRSPVKAPKAPASKGFKLPYSKRPKTADSSMADMSENDRAFHESMKPSWGPDGTLVYAAPSNPRSFGRSSRSIRQRDGLLTIQKGGVVSESRDVHFAKFSNEASAKALKKHMEIATLDESMGVPFAALPTSFAYSDFIIDADLLDEAAKHENLVWQLASVLWDDIAVPDELQGVPHVQQRLRKDMLSAFWEKLVNQASTQQVALVRTNEEKAIAALSGHKIHEACGHLLEGRDYHLATLVALIGGKESSREDIREQLKAWKDTDVLADFSQPIRALYELLAGNVCDCDGAQGVSENRIDHFVLSTRFGLDWRQAFGMRLWYGISTGEDIHAAVTRYAEEVAQQKEETYPMAWYVEQKIEPLWDDVLCDDREDLLWGLLKIFTFHDADNAAIIRPENSQLSPLDMRLCWQLGRALSTAGSGHNHITSEVSDQDSLAFTSQLTNEGSWIEAIFVLLHLWEDNTRAKAIRDHLARHAGHIGAEDSQNFKKLTESFHIPAAWIWEAKALYMRSVKKDPRAEVDCLIKAGMFEEAHRTFTKDVAPKIIIERDYETLRILLAGFEGMENGIANWHLGGEIYHDFLILLDSHKTGKGPHPAVIQRLLVGPPAVVQDSQHATFMETVAMEEISGVVAKAVAAMGKKGEKAKILSLPLTEDKYLKHTIDLSLVYYRDIMAGGK